jgi:hypothetical protein
MNKSRRILLFTLSLIFILYLVIVFWPFIVSKIIVPISTALWIGLRIFILSVDQKLYWVAFTLGILVLIFRRLVHGESSPEPDQTLGEVVKFKDIDTWQNNLSIYSNSLTEQQFIRHKLIDLLTAMYAAEQEEICSYMVLDAIRRKEIPLPEPLFLMLFPEEPERKQRSIMNTLKKIWLAPSNWIRQNRISKNRTMETRRMITEVLTYIETSLEMNHEQQ